jgi:hypothetical protein
MGPRTAEGLGDGTHEGGGLRGPGGIEGVEQGLDAADDGVVEVDKGGVRVGVDGEQRGDRVGGGVEEAARAGKGAEDGEGVFGIVGDVGIEEDEDVGKKVREGERRVVTGGAVPLGRGHVEDDREVGGRVHPEKRPEWASGLNKHTPTLTTTLLPLPSLSESTSRAPVTKALPALAVTMG